MWRVKSLDAILATAEKKSLHRSLGPVQLTLLGVGAIIGTGIFVLTAAASQKAGPGMMYSFIIAGAVCAVAALCYSELAAMAPVSGSAYTYTYAVMGELLAWTVGWALILEYAVAASAVSVGWSGYVLGLIENALHFDWPDKLQAGPVWTMNGFIPTPDFSAGLINVPAIVVALAVTLLLMIGTTESARVNAILVAIKVAALTAFIVLTLPVIKSGNFQPFAPNGWFGPAGTTGMGIVGAAASIFFAYVGFDAVSTAAEETKNPQRNVPIGLIGSLAICTIFYLLVAAGAVGAIGAQLVLGADGHAVQPGSPAFTAACALAQNSSQLVCSNEALAHVLREINFPAVGNALGIAAMLALPSVILMMIYGQTRIFFVMARDGLLPESFAKVHPKWKTPYIVTL
ncbi:amino acid permease, partial [Brevundimonas sp.]|uniref:amino acid permease n=1 Tax=Brevundimonas sp. TaxID=1871086 RepID=UPI0025BD3889